jgi:hypothetical protein
MHTQLLQRLAGGALAVGSALVIAGYGLASLRHGTPTPAVVKSPAYLVSGVLTYLGSVLVVLGLPGLVVRQFSRSRKLTLIGAAGFALVTIIDGISITFADVTLFPVLIGHPATRAMATGSPPPIMAVFYLAATVGALATALLGIGVLRSRVFPRWTGVMLLAAVAVFPLSASVAALGSFSPILAGAAMTGIGGVLVSEPAESTPQAAAMAESAAA